MSRSRALACVALLALIAFGLQSFRLDAKGLWTDEGLSVYRARLAIPDILTNHIVIQDVVTTDTHPPLYFVLLHLWRGLAGETEFALRWLSVFLGVLVIPLLYVAGRRLASPQAGVWAALAGALSPFVVWYAQDARMYTLLLAEALLSTYMLFRVGEAPRLTRLPIAAYALSAAALMLTHYTGVLLFMLHAIVMVIALWRRAHRLALVIVMAGLIAAVPTLAFAGQRLFTGNEFPTFRPFEELIFETWSAFALGPADVQARPLEQTGLHFVLFTVGIGMLCLRRRPGRAAFVAAWLIFPVVAFYSISFIKPIYVNPRNVSAGLPALFIGIGACLAGLNAWRRYLRVMGVTWLVVWSSLVILQMHFDPAWRKDDIRSLARHIQDNELEGDVIILHDAIIQLTFDYYYAGHSPVRAIPAYGARDKPDLAGQQFAAAAAQARRVWFAWGPEPVDFPRRFLPAWARSRLYRIARWSFHRQYMPVVVDLYATQSPIVDRIPDTARRFEPATSDGLSLLAAQLPPTPLASDAWIVVSTFWQVSGFAGDLYVLDLQLVDAGGLVRNESEQLLWNHFPPYRWPQRTPVRWDQQIRLKVGSPPGVYHGRVRLSNPESNALRIVEGQDSDSIDLGAITIVRPSRPPRVADAGLTRQLDRPFSNGVRLVGYSLPPDELKPGSIFWVDLLWQVDSLPARDAQLRLELRAPDGRSVASTAGHIGGDVFPASEWRVGDMVRTPALLNVPLEERGGYYSLALSLADDAGALIAPPMTLDGVDVKDFPFETGAPPVAYPLEATFGDVIRLHGYDQPVHAAPGATITLSLIWQALHTPDRNWVIFVHLVDAQGRLVAQGDSDPVGGLRPTRTWRPGEVIRDDHTLTLPADLSPGIHAVLVGWYDRDSPERLPVRAAAGAISPDTLQLNPIQVP